MSKKRGCRQATCILFKKKKKNKVPLVYKQVTPLIPTTPSHLQFLVPTTIYSPSINTLLKDSIIMQADCTYNGYQVYFTDTSRNWSDGSTTMHPQTPSLRPLPLSDPGVMEWLDRLVVFPDDVANKINNRIATTDIAVRRFPPGYQLYEKKRSGKRGRGDLSLYGHPSGGRFRSAQEFQTHWLWLWLPRSGGEGEACPCVLCGNEGGS